MDANIRDVDVYIKRCRIAMCLKRQNPTNDKNRKPYQRFFGLETSEQYLIYYTMDEKANTGYIVFIDNENDLDYIDKRDKSSWAVSDIQNFQRCLGKLQQVEASPCNNLSGPQILAFKQILGRAYLQILEKDFSEVDIVINDAKEYLRQRNVETSREYFLFSAGVVALVASIIGLTMCLTGNRNVWIYGILFGILGAFVSIWTRYGKEEMTGLASMCLHFLESISRLFVGAIAAVVIMFAIRSGLMLAIEDGKGLFFLYCVFGFAAGFCERLLPSLMERIIKNEK